MNSTYIYTMGMGRLPHAKGSEGPKGLMPKRCLLAQKVPIPKTIVQVSLAVANDIINLIDHY